jgi:hypothetical protein
MNGIAAKQSRKEVEWRQRLARFGANGQEVKAFCLAEAVSEATFYRWRKQLAAVGGVAPAAGFIDVGVMPPAPAVPTMASCEKASATLEVRLDLGHGFVLQIVRRWCSSPKGKSACSCTVGLLACACPTMACTRWLNTRCSRTHCREICLPSSTVSV